MFDMYVDTLIFLIELELLDVNSRLLLRKKRRRMFIKTTTTTTTTTKKKEKKKRIKIGIKNSRNRQRRLIIKYLVVKITLTS